MKKLLTILAVALLAVAPLGCSEGEKATDLPSEMAAKQLAQRAQAADRDGDAVTAAQLYKELSEKYSHTNFYKEFEEEMLNKGLSLESPLVSKTSIRMFKLQNMLVEYKERSGHYPDPHALKVPVDMWGNSLRVEIDRDPDAKIEFVIFSLGPDKKLKTDDDIVLVYTGHKSLAAKLGDINTKDPAEKSGGLADGLSLDRVEQLAEKGGGIPAPPADAMEEETMSLDELKGSKTGGAAPDEKVKSLDELLGETE